MTGVIEEADDLLALVDNFVVALAAGVRERHRAAFRVLDNVLDADEEVLNFAGLLTDCLRQDDVESVRIGSLSAANDSHVGTICATTSDYLVA